MPSSVLAITDLAVSGRVVPSGSTRDRRPQVSVDHLVCYDDFLAVARDRLDREPSTTSVPVR